MGICPLGSSSSFDNTIEKIKTVFIEYPVNKEAIIKEVKERLRKEFPNPNPKKYTIQEKIQIGKYLILKINYPDCKNYEGNKILVFESTLKKILDINKGLIDPHFSENNKYISPIARFQPSKEGMGLAIKYVEFLESL